MIVGCIVISNTTKLIMKGRQTKHLPDTSRLAFSSSGTNKSSPEFLASAKPTNRNPLRLCLHLPAMCDPCGECVLNSCCLSQRYTPPAPQRIGTARPAQGPAPRAVLRSQQQSFRKPVSTTAREPFPSRWAHLDGVMIPDCQGCLELLHRELKSEILLLPTRLYYAVPYRFGRSQHLPEC